MEAIITGGAGHVGGTLARALLAHGSKVRAMVRSDVRSLQGLDVEKVGADLRDTSSLIRAFKDVEVVFHTAARISITGSDARQVVETNLEGTRNVIAACIKTGVRRLVHFSSIEALHPEPLESPLDETRAFVDGGFSPYAISKARAETDVRAAIAQGLDAVILNPTAIIGPYDFKPSMMGKALMSFARGTIPMMIDGGFDWVDVRDVAEAAIAAARHAPAGGRYIVGGRWASMEELAGIISEVTGSRVPRLHCPMSLAEAWAPISTLFCAMVGKAPLFTRYTLVALKGNRLVTHERAAAELSYCPRDLRTTIRDTCAWFQEQGLLDKA
jgi:dihydroflavonol-4-reductase